MHTLVKFATDEQRGLSLPRGGNARAWRCWSPVVAQTPAAERWIAADPI